MGGMESKERDALLKKEWSPKGIWRGWSYVGQVSGMGD
jgi:hypothetical protein